MTTLAAFLLSITGSIAARVLVSLGIGVFSYAAITTLVGNVITSAQTAYLSAAADTLAIAQLGGAGEALGIISAAMVARASLLAIKKLRPI